MRMLTRTFAALLWDKYQNTGLEKQKNFSVKLSIYSYPYVLAYVLGAQKNRLSETVLLSTHNICFGWKIRFFCYTLLTVKACQNLLC